MFNEWVFEDMRFAEITLGVENYPSRQDAERLK